MDAAAVLDSDPGKAEEWRSAEIVWRQSPDVTEAIGSSVARKPRR